MKKFISIIIILILTLTLFSCSRKTLSDEAVLLPEEEYEIESETEVVTPDTEKVKEDKQPDNEKEPEKEPENQQTAVENKEPEKEENVQTPTTEIDVATVPDYKSFICRSHKKIKWKQVRFTNDVNVTLQFEIPSDWQITKSANGFNISRDENIIGTLTQTKPSGATTYYDSATLYQPEHKIFKSYQTNWYHTDADDTIARVFEFITNQGRKTIQMFLSVDYTELDETAKTHLEESALTVPKVEEEPFPALSETNGSKKILLLGNSFINSSRVDMFLHDMLRDTGYQLITVARGNAQVYTFSNDATICEQIQNGEYAYVFVGCFYTDNSVPAVQILLDCANASNTKLVVFPAHNESEVVFNAALEKYDGLFLLNWKAEIDSLIENGIDKFVLCVDDTYQHSTVYAGYVGAHMVYRKIFNKVPPKLSNSPLTQSQVDGNLYEYASSMHNPEPPEDIAFNGVEYKI